MNNALATTPPVRIALVDDHPTVRAGLRACLSDEPDFAVVAEAANGLEIMDLVRRIPIDVVLLDLAMPRKGGLEALRSIRASAPQVAVLVLSGYPPSLYAEAVLRLGAQGYLDKACDPVDIIATIRRVIGLHPADKATAQPIVSVDTAYEDGSPQQLLTSREFEIFLRLAKGETTSWIAKSLFLTAATVSVHRSRLARKLGLKSKSEITRHAVRHGLMD